jgi:hypothetical protein
LDCFLLVTPAVSDAFGAFLDAADGVGAAFLTGVGIFGAGPDAFKANEGDAMVTVSAICHDEGECATCRRWLEVTLMAKKDVLLGDWSALQQAVQTEAERRSLSKVEAKLGLEA